MDVEFIREGTVDGQAVLAAESVESMTMLFDTVGTYFDGIEAGYGLMVENLLGDRLVSKAAIHPY